MKIYANDNLSSGPLERFVGKDLWFAVYLSEDIPDKLGWYRIYAKDKDFYYYNFVDFGTLDWMFDHESHAYVVDFVDNLSSRRNARKIEYFNRIYREYNASEVLTTAELFHLEDSEVPQ